MHHRKPSGASSMAPSLAPESPAPDGRRREPIRDRGLEMWAVGPLIDQIPAGSSTLVQVGANSVLLIREGDQVHAVIDRCPHAENSLQGGRIRKGRISCPLHGAMFDLGTGASLSALSPCGLTTFDTVVDGGRVRIRTEPNVPLRRND